MGMKHGEFVRSSEFAIESTSNELLCDLTSRVGGKTYLCGGGASGYQDSSVFDAFKVNLKYQNFEHPNYEQLNSDNFLAGLSVIDAAMNVGWIEVKNLLSARYVVKHLP